ncbi:lytic polysaccharide monooxygenase [Micromonospora sp. NBC_01699]|uniref:lytic polysaccharide monooxygenase auxiliary activity family 9 protein n=1 Tax=Micromonospora sp. NBC_01699 TaxID=2975984 RepID=UPI002E377E28|nr:lytic polysaccharide monooxygenase [Micromonospora sp. NBC_01699]
MLTAGIVTVVTPTAAFAHGAAMAPGSRTFLCWKDGLSPRGDIQPNNPACAAAVNQSGANSLYNWFSVLRSDAGGRTTGFVSDGQLCSGGNASFSGYNLARNDWPLTHLTAGGNFNFKYSNWAHHPGTFYFYVTKNSWSPTRALAWSDLEEPFLTVTNPPQSGGVGTNEGHYYFSGQLPTGKSGRHIIYSRWVRSDSQENFFGCSDVVFDGGNGEVTGVGPGGSNPPNPTTPPPNPTTPPPNPTTPPPNPTTPPPNPTTPPPGTAGCTATYRVTGSWSGGFQSEVTVRNTGTSALSGWTTSWTWANGQTIANLWNGTLTQSGSAVTVRNAGHNGSLAANGTATYGFTGSSGATNTAPTVSCSSP